MLRIEAEQQTAVIDRLDLDREGRFLVIGSNDNADSGAHARVCSVP